MKYQANPVIVDAFKITKIIDQPDEHPMILHLENGQLVSPNRGMTARMVPAVGDYWVIQSDGYIYLNPKEVFERKYSRYHEPGIDMLNPSGNYTPGEGTIDSNGTYSGDPAGAEILASLPHIRRD